ncbi:uncharacterized protein [Lolium perenne]|uniref:uncharacterized protein n=1 Tax=Lolium perenne TaxID=4522 RepID=UPI003A99BB1B
MELKIAATGLGWDDAKQTVEYSDTLWNEHLEICNNVERNIKCLHVKFRKRGPKHLDDLYVLFDKAHVIGASAACPGDVSSDESSDDDVVEVRKTDEVKTGKPKANKRRKEEATNEEKDEKSPFFRRYKQTCQKIETGVDKITSFVEASSNSAPNNNVPTIAHAMKLVKECGVQEKTALFHTATLLIVKP